MNSDNEIVRRDIADPYNDLEVIAPNGLYDVYDGINGWSLSADAKFAYFRYNYKKVLYVCVNTLIFYTPFCKPLMMVSFYLFTLATDQFQK